MSTTNEQEKDIKSASKKVKDDLVSQFNEIIDGAERLLKETTHEADEKTHELRERLATKIHDMRETLGDHVQPICNKGKEAIKATDSYVKAHPWASVGIAAATAVVVAQLLRRR